MLQSHSLPIQLIEATAGCVIKQSSDPRSAHYLCTLLNATIRKTINTHADGFRAAGSTQGALAAFVSGEGLSVFVCEPCDWPPTYPGCNPACRPLTAGIGSCNPTADKRLQKMDVWMDNRTASIPNAVCAWGFFFDLFDVTFVIVFITSNEATAEGRRREHDSDRGNLLPPLLFGFKLWSPPWMRIRYRRGQRRRHVPPLTAAVSLPCHRRRSKREILP